MNRIGRRVIFFAVDCCAGDHLERAGPALVKKPTIASGAPSPLLVRMVPGPSPVARLIELFGPNPAGGCLLSFHISEN